MREFTHRTRGLPFFNTLLVAATLFASACGTSAPPASQPAAQAPTQGTAAQAPAGQANAPTTAAQKPAQPAATAAQPASVPKAAVPGSTGSSQAVAQGAATGNSDAPAETVVQRSRNTGRPVTLEVWLTDWEQQTQKLFSEEIVPSFEDANPDIAVNIQYLDWRVFTEKLIAAHAGGVLPDIYQAGAEYVAPLATRGMALELDQYVEAWGERGDFYDSAWNTVTYQGKTYGIPLLSAPQTLMYRQDVLAQAGFQQAPSNWEELMQVAQATTKFEGDRIAVSGFNARPIWHQYVWFLFQNGGEVFTPEGQVAINSPAAVEAMDFFTSMFNGDTRVASKTTIAAPTANVGAMAAGLVAMQLGNQLTVRDFRLNNPGAASDLVIAEPLMKEQQVTTNWTDWVAISKTSRNADAAWKFVQYLAEPDNLLKYNETMYYIPPRKSLQTAGYMDDPQLQKFVTIMDQYGKSISTSPAALEVYQTILQNTVEDAVFQKKTSKQALDDAARRIERALRR